MAETRQKLSYQTIKYSYLVGKAANAARWRRPGNRVEDASAGRGPPTPGALPAATLQSLNLALPPAAPRCGIAAPRTGRQPAFVAPNTYFMSASQSMPGRDGGPMSIAHVRCMPHSPPISAHHIVKRATARESHVAQCASSQLFSSRLLNRTAFQTIPLSAKMCGGGRVVYSVPQ